MVTKEPVEYWEEVMKQLDKDLEIAEQIGHGLRDSERSAFCTKVLRPLRLYTDHQNYQNKLRINLTGYVGPIVRLFLEEKRVEPREDQPLFRRFWKIVGLPSVNDKLAEKGIRTFGALAQAVQNHKIPLYLYRVPGIGVETVALSTSFSSS